MRTYSLHSIEISPVFSYSDTGVDYPEVELSVYAMKLKSVQFKLMALLMNETNEFQKKLLQTDLDLVRLLERNFYDDSNADKTSEDLIRPPIDKTKPAYVAVDKNYETIILEVLWNKWLDKWQQTERNARLD